MEYTLSYSFLNLFRFYFVFPINSEVNTQHTQCIEASQLGYCFGILMEKWRFVHIFTKLLVKMDIFFFIMYGDYYKHIKIVT